MKLVIFKTYKRNLIATSEFTVATVAEYISTLAKFNLQIDELDAVKDLVSGEPVELTVAVEQDYALDV